MSERRVGLVLSGGGARGAYEAGVLSYIADEMPDLLARITVVTGTSVGAVNAAFLVGGGLTPASVRELCDLWRALEIDRMIGFDSRATARILQAGALRLVGRDVPSPVTGLLSVDGITRLVSSKVDWRGIRRTLVKGRVRALAVAATDIASGATQLFVAHGKHVVPNWSSHDASLVQERVTMRAHHVLASAAIPILFPAVRVGERWFMDGGVRYNTPLSPALSLGADALLILAVRAAVDVARPAPLHEFPGFGQVVGKLLDSVFLDRVAFDLDRLTRINDMLESIDLLGPAAVERLRVELARRGRRSYRVIPIATVRPNRDLGALAADYLTRAAKSSRLSFARVLKMLFLDDSGTTGDAASFLLFDGAYADALIETGRADARAARETLETL